MRGHCFYFEPQPDPDDITAKRDEAVAAWLLAAIDEHPWIDEPRKLGAAILFGGPFDGWMMGVDECRERIDFPSPTPVNAPALALPIAKNAAKARYVRETFKTGWFTWDDARVNIDVWVWDQMGAIERFNLPAYLEKIARQIKRSSWDVPQQARIRRASWLRGLLHSDFLPELGIQVDHAEGWFK